MLKQYYFFARDIRLQIKKKIEQFPTALRSTTIDRGRKQFFLKETTYLILGSLPLNIFIPDTFMERRILRRLLGSN